MLDLLLWSLWCTRGIHVLLVYSDSPLWSEYIDRHIKPHLPTKTLTLNWSERRSWKWYSPAVLAFRHFGGSREFNPFVAVFRAGRRTQTFRFWQAFHDLKHGKNDTLELVERNLFQCLGKLEQPPAGDRHHGGTR